MSVPAQQQIEMPQQNYNGATASGPSPTPDNFPSILIGFLQLHPGLVVTFGYLLLTAVGITYDVLFYELFRIPILNFSEPGDFLLAGFRQPVLFLLVVLSVLVLRRLIDKDRKWRQRSSRYKELAENMEGKKWYSTWILYPLTVFVYFFSTTALYARITASQIKAGQGRTVFVELNASDTKRNAREPAHLLLGTNSKYLFLYAPEGGKVGVIPIASVSWMTLGPVGQAARVPNLIGKPQANKPPETAVPQNGDKRN